MRKNEKILSSTDIPDSETTVSCTNLLKTLNFLRKKHQDCSEFCRWNYYIMSKFFKSTELPEEKILRLYWHSWQWNYCMMYKSFRNTELPEDKILRLSWHSWRWHYSIIYKPFKNTELHEEKILRLYWHFWQWNYYMM